MRSIANIQLNGGSASGARPQTPKASVPTGTLPLEAPALCAGVRSCRLSGLVAEAFVCAFVRRVRATCSST